MQDLVVNERLIIPARDLRWRFSRSSGPGGQGVNTTDSRVELVLDVEKCSGLGPFRRARLVEHFETRLVEGCLRVVVAEERSQWQNRQKALDRMAELLREGLQPPPRAMRSALASMFICSRRRPTSPTSLMTTEAPRQAHVIPTSPAPALRSSTRGGRSWSAPPAAFSASSPSPSPTSSARGSKSASATKRAVT